MKGTFALFDIAGYVALLLWGTHMVNFHTAFNLVLALLFILPVERFAQLLVRKPGLWRMENESSERHIRALREQRDDGGGGDVYLRILRDLKRIHSHLAALAYPVLECTALLQERLVRETPSPGNGVP